MRKKLEGLSLYERLRYQELSAGIVHLRGEIDDVTVDDFNLEIAALRDAHEWLSRITIRLTSPGGNAYLAFGVYDILREISNSGRKVVVIAEGLAASAAAMIILQGADKRLAYPTASFLLHEPRRWTMFRDESTSQLEDEAAELNRITNKVIDILASRCSKTEEEVRELIRRREVWMDAEEAKEWGLIDEIIGEGNKDIRN